MKQKSITVAVFDMRRSLLDTINGSGLPAAVIAPVLRELTRAVDDAANETYNKDLAEMSRPEEPIAAPPTQNTEEL